MRTYEQELVAAASRHNEKWSSQQVLRQRNSSNTTLTKTGRKQRSDKTKTQLLLDYTVYHRLSTTVIIVNAATIIGLSLTRQLLDDPQTCLLAIATNLLIAVLIRLEQVVNLLYYTFGLIPHSMPLTIRHHAASLYHLGGIHSGSAISAGIWLIMQNVAVGIFAARGQESDARGLLTLGLTGVLDILVIPMVIFSLPIFRHRHHNIWELLHRWTGWLLLLVLWLHLVLRFTLSTRVDNAEDDMSQEETIYTSPIFYMLIAMTVSILLPWLHLRRVTPRYHKLSNHAIQLSFDNWHVNPCKTPKFSTSPTTEWHAFAGIPERYGCSVIISRAGDWTSRIIDSPPKHLYIRAYPAQGVLYMAKIFKSVLCVITGSGIAPVLGLLDIPGTRFRVLWSTRNPQDTYSQAITERLMNADPSALIMDSSRNGRCDLVEAATQVWARGGIEAVFVISNATVTKEVVKGLRQKQILAYGPIFDS